MSFSPRDCLLRARTRTEENEPHRLFAPHERDRITRHAVFTRVINTYAARNARRIEDEDDRAVTEMKARRIDALPVSAVTGQGIDALLARIAGLVDQAQPIELILGVNDGEALAWLYRNGRIESREGLEDGSTRLQVRLDPQALDGLYNSGIFE